MFNKRCPKCQCNFTVQQHWYSHRGSCTGNRVCGSLPDVEDGNVEDDVKRPAFDGVPPPFPEILDPPDSGAEMEGAMDASTWPFPDAFTQDIYEWAVAQRFLARDSSRDLTKVLRVHGHKISKHQLEKMTKVIPQLRTETVRVKNVRRRDGRRVEIWNDCAVVNIASVIEAILETPVLASSLRFGLDRSADRVTEFNQSPFCHEFISRATWDGSFCAGDGKRYYHGDFVSVSGAGIYRVEGLSYKMANWLKVRQILSAWEEIDKSLRGLVSRKRSRPDDAKRGVRREHLEGESEDDEDEDEDEDDDDAAGQPVCVSEPADVERHMLDKFGALTDLSPRKLDKARAYVRRGKQGTLSMQWPTLVASLRRFEPRMENYLIHLDATDEVHVVDAGAVSAVLDVKYELDDVKVGDYVCSVAPMPRTFLKVEDGGHHMWIGIYIDGYGMRGRKGIYMMPLNMSDTMRGSGESIFHLANLAKGDNVQDVLDVIIKQLAPMQNPTRMFSAIQNKHVDVTATLAMLWADQAQVSDNCDHGGSMSWYNCARCLCTKGDRCNPTRYLTQHDNARTEGMMDMCRQQIVAELEYAATRNLTANLADLCKRYAIRSNGRFRNLLPQFGTLCVHLISRIDYEHLFHYNLFVGILKAVFVSMTSTLVKEELRARLNAFEWPTGTPKTPDLLDAIGKTTQSGNTMKASRNLFLAATFCLEGPCTVRYVV